MLIPVRLIRLNTPLPNLHFCVWAVCVFVLASRLFAAPPVEVDFERQVRPILAEHCLACHGVDDQTREGGLRLDVRDAAIAGGDSGEPSLVPGDPGSSELFRRVSSDDSDVVMPPSYHGQSLQPADIETLRQWITGGAGYATHWAFVEPKQEPLPTTSDPADQSHHPIDVFVLRRLAELDREPSPAESPPTLCRRLYLDLIGLPPSAEELAEFQRDGYEATVEKLLASQRFGEKWARPWLDAARYSDTNGYEKDMRRDQWIWRDWVIQALNADMPYDQFIIAQVAGDLLPDATQDQKIATGFLRNSMINEEGAIVPEEFRMVEMFDRLDCVGKAVLGLTTQCAQCHTHKFDPLTQDEYYGMFAYLNNSYEAQSWVYTEKQQAALDQLLEKIQQVEQQIRSDRPQWQEELTAWSAQLAAQQVQWEPIAFHDMNSISGLNHPTQERDLSLLMLGHNSDDVYFIGQPELQGATGLRLEVLNHGELPFRGPGRNKASGSWDIREVEVFVQKSEDAEWEKINLSSVTADYSQAEEKHDEGKNSSGPVAFLIDGQDNTKWKADRGRGRRNTPSVAVIQFGNPLDVPEGAQLKIAMRMTDMVGCCRFSLTRSPDPVAAPVDYAAVLALQVDQAERSPEQHAALFSAWRKTVPALQELNERMDQLWQQYPKALTSVLHLAEREPDHYRATHLMNRGEWDEPLHPVQPHVPAALHALEPSEEPPRLQFARWLVDRQSPLAARVAVNRVWQSIFGQGLVETSEDFGVRAPVPEYRDILDWLAVDFMDHGWSTKHLIRRIVGSHTYRQSSQASPELLETDPDNRLLARGPRFRADAEVIRDVTMAIAGLIHHELGGPSIIPPVPQNVLDYNYTYPSYWTPAEGPQRYRRTVYGFRKRSMPDPSMASLDAPNGDFACARRIRSNTPLAALTGLNEPIFVESARAFALRILREGGSFDPQRIHYAYQLCMSREPSEQEREAILELLASQRQRIAEGWLNPREIATGKADQLPPDLPESATPQDAAAWTIAARVLLNLDETISKN